MDVYWLLLSCVVMSMDYKMVAEVPPKGVDTDSQGVDGNLKGSMDICKGYSKQEEIQESPSDCVKIVTKNQWGGEPALKLIYTPIPVKYVIVHHSVTSECDDKTSCSRLVRSMQNYHITEKVFYDIAYNFLLGGDGKVYEGSGWHKAGAPSLPYNNRSMVISFIGDFSNVLPNQKQLNAAKNLIKCGMETREIDYNYKLLGGRQVRKTESPGEKLYKELQTWSHYTRWP